MSYTSLNRDFENAVEDADTDGLKQGLESIDDGSENLIDVNFDINLEDIDETEKATITQLQSKLTDQIDDITEIVEPNGEMDEIIKDIDEEVADLIEEIAKLEGKSPTARRLEKIRKKKVEKINLTQLKKDVRAKKDEIQKVVTIIN